ncbi:MAG: trypsin-like peptidase domain-containing protein [Oligoflexia bacterium]|nr:trypsin-like peptidase domain-containing protein [Oligoflexia bacterium]
MSQVVQLLFTVFALVVVSNNIYASNINDIYSDSKVIYGVDNRVEFSASNPIYKEWAKSTAAMIPKERLIPSKDFGLNFTISPSEDDMTKMFCEGESFKDQVTAANCSGFLVAPDIIITAGHCYADKETACSKFQWVFGYSDENASLKEKGEKIYSIKSKDIYSCKEVINQRLDEPTSTTMIDFSVIRLDRPVVDRTPLKFRKEGKIADNAEVIVIGHPTGLPLKIADSAKLRKNDHDNFFVANLDTFAGNSGSAVLDAKTGVVEGILVRGDIDYDLDFEKYCYKVRVCESDACRGEDSTRITVVPELSKL